MQEIILIRHGQSKHNINLTTNLDSELTKIGESQTITTAQFLLKEFPNIKEFHGITSPYIRCLQTTNIIQKFTNTQFTVQQEPREIMTIYNTIKIPNRDHIFPQFHWKYNQHWHTNKWIFHTETNEEFLKRINNFTQTLPEKTIIISHGTPIDSICNSLQNIQKTPDTINFPKNASISYIKNKSPIFLNKITYQS